MKVKNLLLLLLLATLWGPSFLFIKVALEEIDPITLAALRIGIAALLLNLYVIPIRKTFVRNWKFWKHATIAGFFAQGLPFVLINWGEQYIDSTLASILNGLTPIFTLLIASLATREDRLTWPKVLGTALGFLGLIVLISPSFQSGVSGSLIGVLAVSVAAVSYGIALIYSRKHLKNTPPLAAPASQLLMTSLYIIPFAWFVDSPNLTSISAEVFGAVFFLAFFGTALAFVVYFILLEKTSASYVSQVTYLMPVFGVLLGYTFLKEPIFMEAIVGGSMILLGIVIINKSLQIKGSKFTSPKERFNLELSRIIRNIHFKTPRL